MLRTNESTVPPLSPTTPEATPSASQLPVSFTFLLGVKHSFVPEHLIAVPFSHLLSQLAVYQRHAGLDLCLPQSGIQVESNQKLIELSTIVGSHFGGGKRTARAKSHYFSCYFIILMPHRRYRTNDSRNRL